jgi:hypothetical protein
MNRILMMQNEGKMSEVVGTDGSEADHGAEQQPGQHFVIRSRTFSGSRDFVGQYVVVCAQASLIAVVGARMVAKELEHESSPVGGEANHRFE